MIARTYSIRDRRLLPSDPLPPGHRAGRSVAHGSGPPRAPPRSGPAVLAAAGHGARAHHDVVGGPAPLGDVRRLGGRRGARGVPRALRGRAALVVAGPRALRPAPGAGPV